MKVIRKFIDSFRLNKSVKTISQSRLHGILNEQLPKHNIIPFDKKYFVPSHNSLKKALQNSVVDELSYVKSRTDCENFSLYLHSILAFEYGITGCGVVLSFESEHAFNIVLTHKNGNIKVHKIEPQDDRLWQPESPEREGYIVKDQIILI